MPNEEKKIEFLLNVRSYECQFDGDLDALGGFSVGEITTKDQSPHDNSPGERNAK